jgi:hypothetical protein
MLRRADLVSLRVQMLQIGKLVLVDSKTQVQIDRLVRIGIATLVLLRDQRLTGPTAVLEAALLRKVLLLPGVPHRREVPVLREVQILQEAPVRSDPSQIGATAVREAPLPLGPIHQAGAMHNKEALLLEVQVRSSQRLQGHIVLLEALPLRGVCHLLEAAVLPDHIAHQGAQLPQEALAQAEVQALVEA